MTDKSRRLTKFYGISVLMFMIPAAWFSLVVPMFSIYMFPNGINVSFAKADSLKPMGVLGDPDSHACLGKVGASENALSNLAELLDRGRSQTDVDKIAAFVSEEAARRLRFMNLSEALWAISAIGAFVGAAACFVGRGGMESNRSAIAAYIILSTIVLVPMVIALALTNFGNDLNDLFQFDFIGRNADATRPIGWVERFTGDPTAVSHAMGYDIVTGVWGRVQTFIGANVIAAFGSVNLISWGLAGIFANLATQPPSADYLRAVRTTLRYSLYASAAVFTLGVLTESSLHVWALLFARPYDECLQLIIGELRTFIGLNYAIAIGLSFLPVFGIWSYRTKQLAIHETQSDGPTSQEWQKANGLDVTLMDFIRSFVLIVLPAVIPNAVSFLAKIPI